jgi:hypothetical protein
MCRPCLYTAHVYRDDVTLNLGRYYIYEWGKYSMHTSRGQVPPSVSYCLYGFQ